MTKFLRAEKELCNAGLYHKDSDYGGRLGVWVSELLDTLSDQNHSGESLNATLSILNKLIGDGVLNPLTYTDDEFELVPYPQSSNGGVYQNIRDSRIIKDNEGIYFVEAIKFRTEDGMEVTGNVNGVSTFQYINKGQQPKTFFVEIDKDYNFIDHQQVVEAISYYS